MTVPTSALAIEIDRQQQLPIYLQICAGATASMSLHSLCSYGLVSDEPIVVAFNLDEERRV
ncbi:hypothetical protein B0G81_1111 [Paraburkholderia sp. BL6665CI2N2]|uniref:hypothetical protein n=1 Tax=Paraburkholderia sp. BL6665CI2N2 TaxID=1938806 RepID=UPI001065EEFE|nr:hypothetical protein [Paraburkholderia sp. BL6665CI2N2]TDY20934.1 hypothetical protein B0G81_1111 [Paraburkholderia sp. BL6665CI2N2]